MTEIKKETSWKIPDLESMLKTRITETKATALVHELEANLISKIDLNNDRLMDRLFNSFKDCSAKVDNCLEFAESRHGDLKRELLRLTGVAEQAVPMK